MCETLYCLKATLLVLRKVLGVFKTVFKRYSIHFKLRRYVELHGKRLAKGRVKTMRGVISPPQLF